MLVTFSAIFVAGTKRIFSYILVAPLIISAKNNSENNFAKNAMIKEVFMLV